MYKFVKWRFIYLRYIYVCRRVQDAMIIYSVLWGICPLLVKQKWRGKGVRLYTMDYVL